MTRTTLHRLLLAVTALLLLAALGVGGYALWLWPQLPPLDRVTDYQPRQPLQVLTADGVDIAQFGAERRQFVPIAEIPKRLQDAVLAVEDARFRRHFGIDLIGLARAAVALATGGMRQGASTITQQVSRTFFLTPRFTFDRKIREALLSLQIEQRLSKDQILELYLNQIYLGGRAYGFAAAAQAYFGKPMAALSVAETAMLAGIPQNPYYANPAVNFERARARQRIVLKRMLDTGVIDHATWAAAREEVLRIRKPLDGDELHAEYVAEMARKLVVEQHGTEVYSQGLKVFTSLRSTDQAAAWASLRRGLLDMERRQPWRGPEDSADLPAALADAELERAAARALRDRRDDDMLRVAIVHSAGPREVLAQLATGERVRLEGEGLRWAQPALAPKAPADLALRRGSVIRVMRSDRWAARPGEAASAAGRGATPARGSAPAATGASGRPASAGVQPGSAAGVASAAAATGKPVLAEGTWAIAQWPEAQAALVAMDPSTGRVRAWVGGFDFNRQPFDHVLQAQRQPGSSFKPFLYSAALEHGVMPETLVNDAPLAGGEGIGGWNPRNSDGRFDGPMTLRQALARSKNLVSIRVLQQIGLQPARQWAERFGFEAGKLPDNLTFALGTGSTSPLQMAQAYAVLANGGRRVAPVVIERIVDARGKVLFEAPPAGAPAVQATGAASAAAASAPDGGAPTAADEPALPARNVFIVNSLLNDVTRVGTAAKAQAQLGRPDLYGKTGTTNDAVDAWFAGFHPSLVAVVWVGHDQPESLGEGESGGGVALPIWIGFMRHALAGVPVRPEPPPPEGVVWVHNDWRYVEHAEGGGIAAIGLDPVPVTAADAPASAASR